MNIIKREWSSYARSTLYWSIGILVLLFISFYKMQGLAAMPGGIQSFLETLPPVFQLFFGGNFNPDTTIGLYCMIHPYIVIAIALHAVLLGAGIFAKEERDKTTEFLYVKGVKRWNLLMLKIVAGMGVLCAIDLVCVAGIYGSCLIEGMRLPFLDLLPYLGSFFFTQIFFFSFALLLSLLLRRNQLSGSIGCSFVLLMFMITMIQKIGGSIESLDQLSIFHYADPNYISVQTTISFPIVVILALSLSALLISQIVHQRRDLF